VYGRGMCVGCGVCMSEVCAVCMGVGVWCVYGCVHAEMYPVPISSTIPSQETATSTR